MSTEVKTNNAPLRKGARLMIVYGAIASCLFISLVVVQMSGWVTFGNIIKWCLIVIGATVVVTLFGLCIIGLLLFKEIMDSSDVA